MSEQSGPSPPIPKFDLHSLLLYFLENWVVIRRHYVLFGVAVIVAAVAMGIGVRQFDTRQIDILTADNNNLRDQKTALLQSAATVPPSQWRRLSDQQRSDLIQALKQWPSKPKAIAVSAMAESESRQYAAQFVDLLRAADIEPHPKEVPLATMADVGLMVGVTLPPGTAVPSGAPWPAIPSSAATEFLDILQKAGLKAHYTPWVKIDNEPGDFDIFIGPKPW
jgi:hypothetical protein